MPDITQILNDQANALLAVDSNPELTSAAKDARKQAIRETYQQEYEQARDQERAKIEARFENMRKAVYKVPTDAGASMAEAAQVYSAFRNAWSDVQFATEGEGIMTAGETLGGMLEQANRVGDTLLATAVYHKAVDLGLDPAVSAVHRGPAG